MVGDGGGVLSAAYQKTGGFKRCADSGSEANRGVMVGDQRLQSARHSIDAESQITHVDTSLCTLVSGAGPASPRRSSRAHVGAGTGAGADHAWACSCHTEGGMAGVGLVKGKTRVFPRGLKVYSTVA